MAVLWENSWEIPSNIVFDKVWSSSSWKSWLRPELNVQYVTVCRLFTPSILWSYRAPEMTWYQTVPQTARESAPQSKKTTVSSEPQILNNIYGLFLFICAPLSSLQIPSAQWVQSSFLCNTQLDPLTALCLKAAARHVPLRVCCMLLLVCSWDLAAYAP